MLTATVWSRQMIKFNISASTAPRAGGGRRPDGQATGAENALTRKPVRDRQSPPTAPAEWLGVHFLASGRQPTL